MASSRSRRHAAPGAAGAGEWAAVSGAGAWRVEEVGKHQLMRRTGLTARDLRALDPALSYPSSVMARDRAVVVNLERVRAVVTAAEVLVPGPSDPAVAPLVRELCARLTASATAASPAPPHVSDGEAAENGGALLPSPGGGGGGDGKDGGRALGRDKVLPFEFRALEVCLEFACKSLEQETCTLEKAAYPALDELSSKVSTLNLERVRQIKSRLVAISGRVQKVRDELEHLLDDDMDMAAMHLSEKLAYQAVEGHSSRLDVDNEPSEFDEERDGEVEEEGGSSEGGYGNGTSAGGFTPKIDELEILLEAYFVQIDGTLNKLSTLREYVDDTEDYINIMLDDKQNQLLQMGIMLSTGTLVVSCAIAVTGVFGMNITIPLYEGATDGVFWQVTGGIAGATAAIYLVALFCYRRSGILQ
ncbi:putative magnesium transporter MRS2-D [Dichanthelium oligosanthes]|uniref:Magnesium transporter n=1 Tax=Dichanthelium oligosanthes TaxID=888268 RepID=A0A1E5VG79_9POAL|nr:putative magnesium transporter MRS2-D [Dichanthelium oligosanthes]